MNKGRLIGGIVCLVVAVLLGVLAQVLEPGQMTFMIGGQNRPWLPAFILGLFGILLLAALKQGANLEPVEAEPELEAELTREARSKNLEVLAGMLITFIMIVSCGTQEVIPEGLWTIGYGSILLALNQARCFYQIKMSSLTDLLGSLAVAGGIVELTGLLQGIEGLLLFLIIIANLPLRRWIEKRAWWRL